MAEWNFPGFAHGGDYNPDQWLHRPDILEEDIRLMKLANCNIVSLGIFAWSALEPEEGVYNFEWLKSIIDRLYANGIHVMMATPSGARPAWMSEKYPEVLRVRPDGGRNLHGGRHNHCYTSPVYREFVRKINTKLAEEVGHHPAVVGWHLSNEYGGECHCELCQEAFRDYLKERYETLDALNLAWWNSFWSHTITDWSQIHSPTPIGEEAVHGLTLDWHRFVTKQTVDFMKAEAEAVRRINPNIPVTTNMMLSYDELDYYRFADAVDFISFDCYPDWGMEKDDVRAAEVAGFNYDMMRSLKDQPWILMESTPSQVNWKPVCKLKRPGVHLLASMQAVAHGADAVMYFQWRKSRGSSEKFHGAVVDHVGHENTRVFREVTQVGEVLGKIREVCSSRNPKHAAIIYDMDNLWAQNAAQGPCRDKQYLETILQHYGALKWAGLTVDIIDEGIPFDDYAIVVAPQMYLVKPGVADRLKSYVYAGGTLVSTYFSGIVDDTDLVSLGGWPRDMMELFGIWAEETDPLCSGEKNAVLIREESGLPVGRVPSDFMCDIIHANSAKVMGTYESDFYAGYPALTCNDYGKGHAWYMATRMDQAFLKELYTLLAGSAGVQLQIQNLPYGVHVDERENETGTYLFVQNFSSQEQGIQLPKSIDMITDALLDGSVKLPVHGVLILKMIED